MSTGYSSERLWICTNYMYLTRIGAVKSERAWERARGKLPPCTLAAILICLTLRIQQLHLDAVNSRRRVCVRASAEWHLYYSSLCWMPTAVRDQGAPSAGRDVRIKRRKNYEIKCGMKWCVTGNVVIVTIVWFSFKKFAKIFFNQRWPQMIVLYRSIRLNQQVNQISLCLILNGCRCRKERVHDKLYVTCCADWYGKQT